MPLALVEAIGEHIEEEVTIRIGEASIVCFAGSCPTLRGSALDAGVLFEDATFAVNYAHLDGKRVTLRVDRIDASFLPRQ